MPAGYIIAEETYLGTFRYASQAADSWGWPSRAYFCASCGEIWARVVLENLDGTQAHFRIAEAACRRHKDYWNIPGSLLTGELIYNLNELSLDCIKREFKIHLDYYESLL